MLVYTTQVNGTFRAGLLASSEVISQVLFTSEQPKKNKMTFVAIFSQIKLLFGPLVIQLVWFLRKQLFTSMSVKVVDIDLAASLLGKYPPLVSSKTLLFSLRILKRFTCDNFVASLTQLVSFRPRDSSETFLLGKLVGHCA